MINRPTILAFLLGAVIGQIIVSPVYFTTYTNHTEAKFIETSDCHTLYVLIDANEMGKDFFAQWTFETQKTVNMRITDNLVSHAKIKYFDECLEHSNEPSDFIGELIYSDVSPPMTGW